MKLDEYRNYFDEELIRILGQMDAPSQILDFLYLGSEWNASNLEELQRLGSAQAAALYCLSPLLVETAIFQRPHLGKHLRTRGGGLDTVLK